AGAIARRRVFAVSGSDASGARSALEVDPVSSDQSHAIVRSGERSARNAELGGGSRAPRDARADVRLACAIPARGGRHAAADDHLAEKEGDRPDRPQAPAGPLAAPMDRGKVFRRRIALGFRSLRLSCLYGACSLHRRGTKDAEKGTNATL